MASVTNNLKPQVDVPVWEWLNFAPVVSTALSATCTTVDQRYIYYMVGAAFYRYDTYSDGWQQLATPLTAPSVTAALVHKESAGYTSRVISATSTTLTAAFLDGKILNGATIKIVQGTGSGQTRVITSIADAVAADVFLTTTTQNVSTSTAFITDSTKTWTVNQYVGYQCRITFGTGSSQVRPILYNSSNTIYTADVNYSTVHGDVWGGIWATSPSSTAGVQSAGVIESSVATINSAWTITPDDSSIFQVISTPTASAQGAVWYLTSSASSPFYTLQRYDVASDSWYNHTGCSSYLTAALNTDFSIETTGKSWINYVSSTATSGSTTTLVDTTQTWTTNRWANYRVSITGGTGVGKWARIVSNTSNTLTVIVGANSVGWTTPDNTSTYIITGDEDKLYFTGNANSALFQHAIECDMLTTGVINAVGVCNGGAATRNNTFPVGLTTLTFSGTTATATTVINHMFKTGDSITISGITGASASLYNITATITVTGSTTFTYTMSSTPSVNGVITTQSTTTVTDMTANWATNAYTNMICAISTPGPNATTQLMRIASNTSNTLTLISAVTTAAVNGTSRYLIMGYDAFGSYTPGLTTTSTSGIASTTGSTTTLTDSTKNWPVNYFAGRRVKFTSGTGVGQEALIASNTATVLTFGAVTTAPLTNTTYSIYSIPARGVGTGLEFAYNTSDTTVAGMYMWSFRGGVTNEIERYNIGTMQWELVSTMPQFETYTTGSQYRYDGVDRIYFTKDLTQRCYYLDLTDLHLEVAGQIPYPATTAIIGQRFDIITTADGLKYLYTMRQSSNEYYRMLIWW